MENISFSKYTIISEADMNWGIAATTVGYHKIFDAEQYPPNTHPSRYAFDPKRGRVLNEYQLIYVTRGGGVFKSRNSPAITIKDGDIYVLSPGEWHTYKPDPKTGWDEYWVGFRGESVDRLVRQGFFSASSPRHSIGFNEEVISLYNRMIDTATIQNPGFQQLIGGMIMHLLGIIYSADKNQQLGDKDITIRINRAKVIMHENIAGNLTPEDIAAELNISYSWFRRAFKECTGFAPAKYMTELKLQKAKAMLVTSSMSIKEISISLNFDNVEYFSTFFKKLTGKTPMEYRLSNQKFSDK